MAHLGETFGCSVTSHLQRVGKVLWIVKEVGMKVLTLDLMPELRKKIKPHLDFQHRRSVLSGLTADPKP